MTSEVRAAVARAKGIDPRIKIDADGDRYRVYIILGGRALRRLTTDLSADEVTTALNGIEAPLADDVRAI